jgi:[ribosomal protein S18]-alanine N-acetyltransferase
MRRSSGRGPQPVCAELSQAEKGPQVTSCRREDLSEVQAILQASPEAAAWSAAALSDAFERYSNYFLVSRHGQEIAGFISGRRIIDEGEILNLAVKPHLRRHGLGKTLVQALLKAFTQEGAVQVFLEVRVSNAPAISFYQQLGFRQIGERSRYYQNPIEAALVLSLSTDHPVGTAHSNR